MNEPLPSDCAGAISRLLNRCDVRPVLIDIGASGPPRQTWNLIAGRSIFVGFDADLREIRELTGTGFHRAVMVNEAVTAERGKDEVVFFLTRSPYCSSTLEPDLPALADYSFVDLFQVERQVKVRATTLESVLARLELDRVDWFKTDSQGTDLRLFNSLPVPVREGVLCVEIEPGLIDAYKGEDLFIDAHRNLLGQGFWLSDANVCGTARIRQSSVRHLQKLRPEIDADTIRRRSPVTPGWIEATYLRSVDHLVGRKSPARDYVLLWIFSLMNGQLGFALDVALAYKDAHGADETSRAMIAPVAAWLARPEPKTPPGKGLLRFAKWVVPVGIKQWIKDRLK
jgi:hypothetical protein